MTLHELCKEINRWLEVRWKTSEYYRNLPAQVAVWNYAEKLLGEALCDNVYTDTCALTKRELVGGRDVFYELSPEHWNIHMMDIVLKADEKSLCLMSYNLGEGDSARVATIKMDIVHLEMENDKCDAVKNVSLESCLFENTDILSIAKEVSRNFSEEAFFERWASAPKPFQRKHPICPACGGKAYALDFREKHENDYRMTCSCGCGWVDKAHSNYRGDAEDNYIDGGFEKARKQVLHRKETLTKMDEITDSIIAQVETLQTLCGQKKCRQYSEDAKKRLRKIEEYVKGLATVISSQTTDK